MGRIKGRQGRQKRDADGGEVREVAQKCSGETRARGVPGPGTKFKGSISFPGRWQQPRRAESRSSRCPFCFLWILLPEAWALSSTLAPWRFLFYLPVSLELTGRAQALWVGEGAGRDLEVSLRLGGVFDSPWQLGSLVSVPHKWGFWC